MATRKEKVVLDLDPNPYLGGLGRAATGTSAFVKQLDTGNDRATMLTQSLLAVGPALVPLGAAGVPALAGLSTQLGFAAAATGVMLLAFNGVGDGLKALNEYQLEPTAENFAKLQEKMRDLGPDARQFVHFLDDLEPQLQTLREAAQSGIPGVQEGIEEMLGRLPQVRDIIGEIAGASGDLAAETGEALSSKDWDEFFTFLEREAAPNLVAFGRSVGNIFEGIANTWMALDPLSDDFTAGLLDWSRDFSDATEGLDENAGFQDFVAYVQENGPRAMETLGALGNAFLELVEAAAPIGAASLPIIEALADLLAAVADSPAGPVLIGAAAGMSAISRAVGVFNLANGSALLGLLRGTSAEGGKAGAAAAGASSGLARLNTAMAGLKAAGRGAAGLGAVALSLTDVDDKAGLSNTAMGALLGTMIAPGWGTAIGAVGGGLMDLAAVNDDLEDAASRADQALGDVSRSGLRNYRRELEDALKASSQADGLTQWWNDFSGATDDAKSALRGVNTELDNTGGLEILASGLGLTEDAFHAATDSAEEFRTSVARAFGLLDKRAALREARAALREFNKTLKDAPDKMREGGPAYDKVEEALDNIARSSLEAAESLKGMNRVRYLDQQRDAFVDAAQKLGLTARQARRLATDLGLLDKADAKPKVDADTKPAKGKIDTAEEWLERYGAKRVRAILDGDNKPAKGKIDQTNNWLSFLGNRAVNPKIDADNNPARNKVDETNNWLSFLGGRTVTARIDADASGVFSAAAAANSALNDIADEVVNIITVPKGKRGADGMTIPGPRFPYMDQTLILAAPGEELITNRHGEADQFRADRAAGRIPAYADGGTVEQRWFPRQQPTSHTRVVERVVERLPREFQVSTDLGDLVLTAVDDRIGDHRDHDARQAATVWSGVSSD